MKHSSIYFNFMTLMCLCKLNKSFSSNFKQEVKILSLKKLLLYCQLIQSKKTLLKAFGLLEIKNSLNLTCKHSNPILQPLHNNREFQLHYLVVRRDLSHLMGLIKEISIKYRRFKNQMMSKMKVLLLKANRYLLRVVLSVFKD